MADYKAEKQKVQELNLEEQLLYGKENQFGIYQLKQDDESLRDFRFTGTESLKHLGITKDNFEEIKRDNYDLLYVGKLPDTMGLNSIYEKFNLDHPEDFKGHSLSVSDIVVLHKDGENTAHFVDSFGFTELPLFLEKDQVREEEQARDILSEIEQDEIIDLEDEPFEPEESNIIENFKENKPVEVSLFVAECSEFHDMGEFYGGIQTVDQAIAVYEEIPPERMHGIPSIGIQIHQEGEEPYQDTQLDIMTGKAFVVDMLDYYPDIKNNPEAMDKIAELIAMMPENEVHGKLAPDIEQKVLEYREQHIGDMAQSLAANLDQFAYEYDTYGYNDEVEDRESTVIDISRELSAGETSGYKEWLQSVIEEGEPAEDVLQAQDLLKRIEALEKWREYKPLAKVEELEESNYNMIDNVLNNGAGSEKERREDTQKQQKEKAAQAPRKRTSLKERLEEKKSLVSGKPCEAPEKASDKNTERGL